MGVKERQRPTFETVSVLFSEPKIPQTGSTRSSISGTDGVSVLFSEPKIPQTRLMYMLVDYVAYGFSALQRAENSSNVRERGRAAARLSFSALQRAENSSKFGCVDSRRTGTTGFSALQRAENSSKG